VAGKTPLPSLINVKPAVRFAKKRTQFASTYYTGTAAKLVWGLVWFVANPAFNRAIKAPQTRAEALADAQARAVHNVAAPYLGLL